jgi:PhnB protein
MAVSAIPAGYHTVTPYLVIRDVAKALEFYQKAFGATTELCMPMPDGKIMHAEIVIDGSHIMMADENPAWGCTGPQTLGGVTSSTLLYVENVDARFQRALDAGATVLRPLTNQFWGDRMGTITDPFGHVWSLASHIEDVGPEEMQRRSQEAIQQMTQQAK